MAPDHLALGNSSGLDFVLEPAKVIVDGAAVKAKEEAHKKELARRAVILEVGEIAAFFMELQKRKSITVRTSMCTVMVVRDHKQKLPHGGKRFSFLLFAEMDGTEVEGGINFLLSEHELHRGATLLSECVGRRVESFRQIQATRLAMGRVACELKKPKKFIKQRTKAFRARVAGTHPHPSSFFLTDFKEALAQHQPQHQPSLGILSEGS